MASKKLCVAFYNDGGFKVSAENINDDLSIRVFSDGVLVEMTEEEQHAAMVFFNLRLSCSTVDFKRSAVLALGDLLFALANEFISISGK